MSTVVTADDIDYGYVGAAFIDVFQDDEDVDDDPNLNSAKIIITFTRTPRNSTVVPINPAVNGISNAHVVQDKFYAGVMPSGLITDDLDPSRIVLPDATPGVKLPVGTYVVSFNNRIADMIVAVDTSHTKELPLDLMSLIGYLPPPGVTVKTVALPVGGGVAGQVFGWTGSDWGFVDQQVATEAQLPSGGSNGQVLTKQPGGGAGWATPSDKAFTNFLSPMSHFWAGLSKRTTAPVYIMCAGDSLTELGWPSSFASYYAQYTGATVSAIAAKDVIATLPTAAGIYIMNAGIGGRNSLNYLEAGGGPLQNATAAKPIAVVHMVGINDLGPRNASAVASNINAAIERVNTAVTPDPVHIVVIEPLRTTDQAGATFTTEEYRTALAGMVAGRNDSVLLDMDAVFRPTMEAGDPFDLKQADDIHMNASGNDLLGRTMVHALVGSSPQLGFVRGVTVSPAEPGLILVTPTAPTFDDAANTYTIPALITGVEGYYVGGVKQTAGVKSYSDTDTDVTVTAQATAGYSLTVSQWTLNFTKAPAGSTPVVILNDTVDNATTANTGQVWYASTGRSGGVMTLTSGATNNGVQHTADPTNFDLEFKLTITASGTNGASTVSWWGGSSSSSSRASYATYVGSGSGFFDISPGSPSGPASSAVVGTTYQMKITVRGLVVTVYRDGVMQRTGTFTQAQYDGIPDKDWIRFMSYQGTQVFDDIKVIGYV